MQTLDNVISFHTSVKERHNVKEKETTINQTTEKEYEIRYPSKLEILVMNSMIQQARDQAPDDMVPFNMWNGDCYKRMFEEMSRYAKEIDEDPWDVFALFINKLNGWRMEIDDKGGVTVKYSKE